jgi:alpha-glucosidase (family GH31 glycosyl hydrolase)
MNEPSVFNVESKTMPETNIHRADQALGGTGPHARYHNVYGMLMIRASREGIMAVNPDKRPFVLSRANFIGGHRYGATWTGDNTSNWPHVEMSIPMTLNLALSGQPFVGPDLGGFIDDGDAEMYARWFGFGSLSALRTRAHPEGQHRQGALVVRSHRRGDGAAGARAALPPDAPALHALRGVAPDGDADRTPALLRRPRGPGAP